MKSVISILIVAALALGGWRLYSYYLEFNGKDNHPRAALTEVPVTQLPGLPPNLESALQAAQQHGAKGLRDFLKAYGKNVSDPRLAAIELDYVLLVARTDPGEAKRVFAKVKQRTGNASPLFPRVQQLEKTYE